MTDITIKLKNGKEIELNQAFNVDCLDFMRELPDKCIDLVLTDPPYGIGAAKMTGGKGKNKGWEKKDWDSEIPSKEIFQEIFRVSKNQIIWGGNYFNLAITKNWLVWDKGLYWKTSFSDGELAWTSINNGLRIHKYRYDGFIGAEPYRFHPTQKPKNLFVWCLKNYLKDGGIVFDPFLGSFTTAVACNEMGLNWLGCEKDPDYFKSGYHRYEQETKQTLFDFGAEK